MLKLIEVAKFKQFTGGGKDGIFRLILTKKRVGWENRIFDFIEYESSYSKNIIVAVDKADFEIAQSVHSNHSYTDNFLRPYEDKVLVHTTTKENYHSIMKDKKLKSWNLLKTIGAITEDLPIGSLLGDPPEYSDYIMFSSGGISSERVVSSRQAKRLEWDIDVPYIAGARFYFDAEKIAKDGLLVRDGAHLKVKNSLEIDKYILWTATPDILGISESTTPRIFAEKADMTFYENFGIQINSDTRT
jgi:hypothetical protein